MLKKALASLAALVASSPAAFAGPYVNYETNVSFAGSDYTASLHELHFGFTGATDYIDYYVQAGPAVIAVDADDTELNCQVKPVSALPSLKSWMLMASFLS